MIIYISFWLKWPKTNLIQTVLIHTKFLNQIWLGHIGTTICHILGTAVVDPLIGLGGMYCCIDPGSHVLQEQLGRVLQRKVCWYLRPKLNISRFGVLRVNFWVFFWWKILKVCHVKKPSKPQGLELHCKLSSSIPSFYNWLGDGGSMS